MGRSAFEAMLFLIPLFGLNCAGHVYFPCQARRMVHFPEANRDRLKKSGI
jgi:hypothetical protein